MATIERSSLLLLSLFTLTTLAACGNEAPRPELMTMVVESSSPYVQTGTVEEVAVTVDIEAVPPRELDRKRLNLSLVIDHSGSMNGQQLQDAKDAVTSVLAELEPEDTVSVVAFSSRVAVLQPQAPWEDVEVEELEARLAALTPRGTTALNPALTAALQQVSEVMGPDDINRVILLSDGHPNDPTMTVHVQSTAIGFEIPITTMGLGPHYNEELMAQLADTTGGRYRFIKDSGQIARYFREEKAALEKVVARNASLTFTLGPGVSLARVHGAPFHHYGQQVTVALGDLDAQTTRKIGLRLSVAGQPAGARVEVMDAALAWDDVLGGGERKEQLAYVEAQTHDDAEAVDRARKAHVLKRLEQFGALDEMNEAVEVWQGGDQNEARRRMSSAARRFSNNRLYGGEGAPVVAPQPREPLAAPEQAEAADQEAAIDAWLTGQVDKLEGVDPTSSEGKILVKDVKATARSSMGR